MRKLDVNNAQNPSRLLAIHILESIAEKLGNEDIFDCKNEDTKWYDFEDMITNLIEEVRIKDKDKITRRNKQIKDLKERIKKLEEKLQEIKQAIIENENDLNNIPINALIKVCNR